jgi:hypothetical protein
MSNAQAVRKNLSKNKESFFEKKNQKTSAPLREGVKPSGIENKKVFCGAFFQKSDRLFFPT